MMLAAMTFIGGILFGGCLFWLMIKIHVNGGIERSRGMYLREWDTNTMTETYWRCYGIGTRRGRKYGILVNQEKK